jgi:hypothetical protein
LVIALRPGSDKLQPIGGCDMALWVENEARRANRNLLLMNGGILAIIILVIAGNYRYCANFVLGA